VSLLGLDVGLSGCRAVAVSADGDLLADVGRGYQPPAKPDACELDVRAIWAAVSSALTEAARRTASDPLAGLAVSSVGGAIVPLGRDGSVLSSCVLANPARDREAISRLLTAFGPETLYDITGQLLGRSHAVTRLGAIRQERPELYRATWRFVLLGGLVAHLLGANTLCDYSLAGSTLCFDMHQRAWSREILAAHGLSPVKLPLLGEAGTPVGVISSRAARELELPPRLTIVLGGHDLACHALGVGAARHGMAALVLGPAVHMMPVFHAVPLSAMMLRDRVSLEHHVAPTLLIADGAVRAGGSWVRWFSSEITPVEHRAAARRGLSPFRVLMDEMPEAPSPLLASPPLEGLAPQPGSIRGLGLGTTRGQLVKGMLEGVALENARVVQRLEANGISIDTIRVTGGGSRMDRWALVCADVLGKPLERTRLQQSAALGAAILAGVGIGAYDDLGEGVDALVQVEHTFEPDMARHRVYAQRLAALDASSNSGTTG